MRDLERGEFRRIIGAAEAAGVWPRWRGPVGAPSVVAQSCSLEIVRVVLPRALACASDGQRVWVTPDENARLEGLRAWGGIAVALLTRLRRWHTAADAWLFAAELAAPVGMLRGAGAADFLKEHTSAPRWFLRDWAVGRGAVAGPPASGTRHV